MRNDAQLNHLTSTASTESHSTIGDGIAIGQATILDVIAVYGIHVHAGNTLLQEPLQILLF